jgi:hypothetical protein
MRIMQESEQEEVTFKAAFRNLRPKQNAKMDAEVLLPATIAFSLTIPEVMLNLRHSVSGFKYQTFRILIYHFRHQLHASSLKPLSLED